MNRWIRRTAIGAVLLVAGAGMAFVIAAQLGERKLDRTIEVMVAAVAYQDGAAVVERGRRAACTTRPSASRPRCWERGS